MPAFDDIFRLPGKGGNTPNSGRRIKSEKSHRQRAGNPLKTPSPVTDPRRRRAKRKRSQERLASDKASKKARNEGHLQPGHGSAPIDLTGDDDPVESSAQPLFGSGNGPTGLIRDTTLVDLTRESSVDTVETPLLGDGPAPRDVKPAITPAPSSGVRETPDLILVPDSEDESEKPSTTPSTPVRKTAQSPATENPFGLVTPNTPKTPRPIAQPKRRRAGPIDGQARPDGSSPGQGTMPLTPAHVRLGQLSELPFQRGRLTAGSPGAPNHLQSPFEASPAREVSEELVLANASLPAVPEREADQVQPRQGSESVSRVVVRKRNKFIVLLKAPADELLRIFGRVQRPEIPIRGKCFLERMPAELQKSIFEYLLRAADPILLLNQWSELKPCQTLGLHPEILRTCKSLYFNGRDFLYGENTFQYLVRDTPQQGASESSNRHIYVDDYMQHFCRVQLTIERFRTTHAYYTSIVNALHLLIEHGTRIHTLTIDVSPTVEGDTLSTVGYFYKNGDIVEALKALLPKYFIIRVFTPKTDSEEPASLRREFDLRIEPDRFGKKPMDSPQGENDDQDKVKLQQEKLDNLCDMMTRACESPSKAIKESLFEEFEVVPRHDHRNGKQPSTATYSFSDEDPEYGSETNDGDDGDEDYVN